MHHLYSNMIKQADPEWQQHLHSHGVLAEEITAIVGQITLKLFDEGWGWNAIHAIVIQSYLYIHSYHLHVFVSNALLQVVYIVTCIRPFSLTEQQSNKTLILGKIFILISLIVPMCNGWVTNLIYIQITLSTLIAFRIKWPKTWDKWHAGETVIMHSTITSVIIWTEKNQS